MPNNTRVIQTSTPYWSAQRVVEAAQTTTVVVRRPARAAAFRLTSVGLLGTELPVQRFLAEDSSWPENDHLALNRRHQGPEHEESAVGGHSQVKSRVDLTARSERMVWGSRAAARTGRSTWFCLICPSKMIYVSGQPETMPVSGHSSVEILNKMQKLQHRSAQDCKGLRPHIAGRVDLLALRDRVWHQHEAELCDDLLWQLAKQWDGLHVSGV